MATSSSADEIERRQRRRHKKGGGRRHRRNRQRAAPSQRTRIAAMRRTMRLERHAEDAGCQLSPPLEVSKTRRRKNVRWKIRCLRPAFDKSPTERCHLRASFRTSEATGRSTPLAGSSRPHPGDGAVPPGGVLAEVVTDGLPVRSGCQRQPDQRETTDDRRHDEPAGPRREDVDADLLREMIGFAAERLMELEVGAVAGATCSEKSLTRRVQRNGYRERSTYTSTGDAGRHDRAAHPKAEEGQLLPRLS